MIPAPQIHPLGSYLKANHFKPGQRWISSAEPEAGLGIIIQSQNRRVEVSFPAIGESRVYAVDNAPLNRIQYREGDSIHTNDGERLKVLELTEEAGRIFYLCETQSGGKTIVDELDLDSFVHFNTPLDKLYSGQLDSPSRYRLRRQTLEYQRQLHQIRTPGLLGARAQLLPHQFYIASEVAARHAPRVLLADEVGLGKTIEAGLILHQQLVTGRVSRVLIVVPESLIHQWLVEMLRRFNLMFSILDEKNCRNSREGEWLPGKTSQDRPDNPFERAQLVLCSLSFLVANPERQQQAHEAGWDVMVVDEAHHLHWEDGRPSEEYQCIETLAAEIPGLILLTATPEQLGLEGHFARLKLLDPARYSSLENFRREESSYHQVRQLVEDLLAHNALDSLRSDTRLLSQLNAYLGDAVTRKLREDLDAAPDHQQIVEEVVQSLVDRHGTGRVLFRNTREGVAGFPRRQLNRYPLSTPQKLAEAQSLPLEHRLRPEQMLGEDWLNEDPRVGWLAGWLPGLRDSDGKADKVLIICASADTASELESYLSLRRGIRAAAFHEGMSLVQRDRAAAYFADDEEFAQVLICSEIGSEGRNFQFVRHLVLFDLPLNPDLLEQRIGRLDRIGQQHDIQIHVPHYDSGAQKFLLDWYQDGLNAFERVCPIGGPVFDHLKEELLAVLAGDCTGAADLLVKARKLAGDMLVDLQRGRDRLLELSSCNSRRAQDIIQAVREAENPQALADYMENVFDQFGVEHSHHSADALVLHPGDHMQCESFPGLPEDGMTITYQRDKALGREDMHFLSWEHPMVTGVMDMILSGDFGNVNFCTLKLPPLKQGSLFLEAIFSLHCPAPKSLQLHRFLPLTSRRVVVDATGRDFTAALTVEHFDKLGKKVELTTAQKVIRHARPQLDQMIEHCERLIPLQALAENGESVVDAALKNMEKSLHNEWERLNSLARVNPNIRQQELDYLVEQSHMLREAIASASWRIEALRVAVTL